MIVSWFSTGVSSFIACYLMKDKVDKILYTHIANQHPDSLRFITDCEKVLGHNIEILQSDYYRCIEDVFSALKIMNTPKGAPCTLRMKKQVRKKWESQHPERHTYIWGFDCKEQERANRLIESMPQYDHIFPLIDYGITKQEAHGMCATLGIKRPVMYDLGYPNNNCVGCVKGGMGYWNKIRVDFPDVFEKRAKQEREIHSTCITGVYLDELDPHRGNIVKEVFPECGINCEMMF